MIQSIYILIDTLGAGGAEKLNINLAEKLDIKSILLLENLIEYDTRQISEKIQILNNYNSKWSALKYFKSFSNAVKIKKILLKDNNQNIVIIASLLKSVLTAIILKKIIKNNKNIKILYWEHANPFYYKYTFGLFKLAKFLYKQSDIILANTKNAANTINHIFLKDNNKAIVFYNFFNFNTVIEKGNEPLTLEESNLIDKHSIVYIGRLTTHKGLEFLIEVFNNCISENPKIKLFIIGKGNLEVFLKQKINEKNLEKNIFLMGFKKNPYKYIKQAQALIFSSENEGFGNVIIESLLLNTPVISADIDNGPREILAPNSNYNNRTDVKEITKYGLLLPSVIFNNIDQCKKIWKESICSYLVNNESKNFIFENLELNKFEDIEQIKYLNKTIEKLFSN